MRKRREKQADRQINGEVKAIDSPAVKSPPDFCGGTMVAAAAAVGSAKPQCG